MQETSKFFSRPMITISHEIRPRFHVRMYVFAQADPEPQDKGPNFWGCGGEPPLGSRGKPQVMGQMDEVSLKLTSFSYFRG